ncbi:hypothetical protein PM038_04445 [Halorubrum ezzemoulense]|jgi:hypothetical protein|uniref:hypothetical protein n=1 Tax=Halorubrum ezzemoulense TaxID=337243 RepID=UPI00232C514B|nr:hypothetical protein [Halorubrum ezzemoulense]MDB2284521.1 hypothetical protein [Halorubrum ezzemoulense]
MAITLLGMNPVKEHVEDLSSKSPPHEYVADHGTVVESDLKQISPTGSQITVSEDITQDEELLIEAAIRAMEPRKRECFSNALKLWLYDHRFKYAEGYASTSMRPDIVVEHAWAMLDGDKIVDLTGEFEHHYGVVISSQETLEQNIKPNLNSQGIICKRQNRDFLAEKGYTR